MRPSRCDRTRRGISLPYGQRAAVVRGTAVLPGSVDRASHDVPFLRELGLTRWLRLDGTLTEIDPL